MTRKKPCPLCGSDVAINTYYCKHCKRNIPAPTTRELASLNTGRWFCVQCEHFGTPKNYTNGAFAIEAILWLMFLVPGLIYTIWRLTTRYSGCPRCGAPHMIPAEAPRAQAVRAALDATEA